MRKGSITIFTTLSMILVAAVLFSLLEGMRFQEIRRISQLQTELAVESFFAKYNVNMWKEYRLLGSEDVTLTQQLKSAANGRQMANNYGLNLFQTQVKDIHIDSLTRITDGKGSAYVYAAVSYMKKQIVYETIQDLYNRYEAIRSLTQGGEIDLSKIDEALQNIENIQKQTQQEDRAEEMEAEVKKEEEGNIPQIENPLQVIKDLQEKGVLELVISDTASLSDKEITGLSLVSNRELKESASSQIPEREWVDKVLFQQYLLSYFSNYQSGKENTPLTYELEYIISGKSKDIENLKNMAEQLLVIRQILNFLYLISDAQAQEEAGVLAVALAGATANPVVIDVVKMGILTAWAFGESILDVRALFAGKKIPLLKSKNTWTLTLADFGRIVQKDFWAKESEAGIRYEDYLGILLLFQNEESLAMRAMDLQELMIKEKYKDSGFLMDQLCIQAEVSVVYEYRPLFDFFQGLAEVMPWENQIQTRAAFSYY